MENDTQPEAVETPEQTAPATENPPVIEDAVPVDAAVAAMEGEGAPPVPTAEAGGGNEPIVAPPIAGLVIATPPNGPDEASENVEAHDSVIVHGDEIHVDVTIKSGDELFALFDRLAGIGREIYGNHNGLYREKIG